jgi:hypothetical protein
VPQFQFQKKGPEYYPVLEEVQLDGSFHKAQE